MLIIFNSSTCWLPKRQWQWMKKWPSFPAQFQDHANPTSSLYLLHEVSIHCGCLVENNVFLLENWKIDKYFPVSLTHESLSVSMWLKLYCWQKLSWRLVRQGYLQLRIESMWSSCWKNQQRIAPELFLPKLVKGQQRFVPLVLMVDLHTNSVMAWEPKSTQANWYNVSNMELAPYQPNLASFTLQKVLTC